MPSGFVVFAAWSQPGKCQICLASLIGFVPAPRKHKMKRLMKVEGFGGGNAAKRIKRILGNAAGKATLFACIFPLNNLLNPANPG
jgi:hypothetical protein